MKRSINNYHHRSMTETVASLMLLLAVIASCSENLDNDVGGIPIDDEITILIGNDDHFTRGVYVEGPSLLKYSIYSFYNDTKKVYLSNSQLSRPDATATWTKTKTVKFPNATRALDFYALAPEFSGDIITQSTMKADNKSFAYTLPTVNGKQTDLMFSSLMGQTRTSTNNIIKFNFKHLFCYLRFQSKLSNENINVTIHSVKLHNLKSTGTFTMDNNVANAGSWTLADDQYATYEFVLPKDSVLTYKKTLTLHRTDSMLFVMPQNPTLFKFTEGSSFAEADANNQAYASVMCRITNKETGAYIGPSPETEWVEVYYPIKSASWVTTKQPFGTAKSVSIEFTGGYTYEGADFLKEYSDNGSLENESIEGVKGGIDASADWEDDTENSVTITL